MARFYSNENFPLPTVEKLRSLGHDVLTVQEAGQADQALPDAEVLAFATREGRAVLTLNRLHFIRCTKNSRGTRASSSASLTPTSPGRGNGFIKPSQQRSRSPGNSCA